MNIQDWKALPKIRQLEIRVAEAQNILNGTALVSTPTCRKCGEYARVRDGSLQLNDGGITGTATLSEIAICTNTACQHVAVRLFTELNGSKWRYGGKEVEMVDGTPFNLKNSPQPITPLQRASFKNFLHENSRVLT